MSSVGEPLEYEDCGYATLPVTGTRSVCSVGEHSLELVDSVAMVKAPHSGECTEPEERLLCKQSVEPVGPAVTVSVTHLMKLTVSETLLQRRGDCYPWYQNRCWHPGQYLSVQWWYCDAPPPPPPSWGMPTSSPILGLVYDGVFFVWTLGSRSCPVSPTGWYVSILGTGLVGGKGGWSVYGRITTSYYDWSGLRGWLPGSVIHKDSPWWWCIARYRMSEDIGLVFVPGVTMRPPMDSGWRSHSASGPGIGWTVVGGSPFG